MASIFKIVAVASLLIAARFAYHAMTDSGARDDDATEPVPGHSKGAPPGAKRLSPIPLA